MSDCLFCKIANKELDSEIVYEDEDFIAFLDIKPVNKGHTLLVPKHHFRNLLDVPKDLELAFLDTARRVAEGVMDATDADGFNLSMNNEPAAGQEVFHAHFHIIPRFEGDGHQHWPHTEYDEDEIGLYAERIAKHIRS